MSTKVVAALLVVCVVVAGTVVLLIGDKGDREGARLGAGPRSGGAGAAPAGSHARFVYLAAQRSNQGGLQASAIGRYARNGRLQGSCCSPMDEHAYRSQLRKLRSYRHLRGVPRDPYDIPLSRRAPLLPVLALERLPRA
jgi:hypothetical protein